MTTIRRLNIYVASSWRNELQDDVVEILAACGHDVYDFKHPPGGAGFSWAHIDTDWQKWTTQQFKDALDHEQAEKGFNQDLGGMMRADICVLVLPCGRSAHLEAGWFVGRGVPVFAYLPEEQEPELMYRFFGGRIADSTVQLVNQITNYASKCSAF